MTECCCCLCRCCSAAAAVARCALTPPARLRPPALALLEPPTAQPHRPRPTALQRRGRVHHRSGAMNGDRRARYCHDTDPHRTTSTDNAVHTNQADSPATAQRRSDRSTRRFEIDDNNHSSHNRSLTHSLTLASATCASLAQPFTSTRSLTRDRTQTALESNRVHRSDRSATVRLIGSSSSSRSLRPLHLRRHE